jgi:maltose alpha-D-glucosyltransferase/alpha-amylase
MPTATQPVPPDVDLPPVLLPGPIVATPPISPVAPPTRHDAWYKSGVIYELHVRAFQDSDADGTGDFRGLTSRLDYLRDLGVTAIWVLPFYPSPLKDDGYDIADYYGVHPNYGTLADFKVFLREAHRRGLRVITELVLNHTSDQHPWFQRARRAKPGSRWRDYYVWSETADKYRGTRVIFKDSEHSNWTWDSVANAYYWHRFYYHQPDLNFDHPAVHDEMIRVLDFWLDLGVDGVRLDAVPYLYEREGTSCENLAETHHYLKQLREHVDTKYKDRMLLAEANQWPDDAVAYFGSGEGDECHMAFHFPLMPRLFMSLRMEDRIPIVDILQQTPPIPETAQWALFLRNHDELTLEMVTEEERDYMYRMYAHIHQARLNLGIRRRLAPLVGNDRRRIELLSALLFSLPGTPVMYYGDEIGMGENIYLGDRNGVRTPMQWSADKNAGFSRANPQSLYLPINLDPENHYEAVNVEVQERNRHSLLWWMRQLIALRKRWKAFGVGSLEFLAPDNRKILAYVRRYEHECVLAVANLSRFVQPVELNLSAFHGRVPVELFGRTEFPPITDKPYFFSLGPHAFYWFSLEEKNAPQVESAGAPVGPQTRAFFHVEDAWDEVLQDDNRSRLETALQAWLPSRRWFAGKARTIKNTEIMDAIRVPVNSDKVYLLLLQVEYVQTDPETYLVPLACALGENADVVCHDCSPLVLGRISTKNNNQDGVLYDAIADQPFCRALLSLIATRRKLPGWEGEMEATHTAVLRQIRLAKGLDLEPAVSKAEQSNSSVVYGGQLILKLFRKLDEGTNPELEIGRFLGSHRFPYSPPLAGALEYNVPKDEPMTLAVLSTFVPGCKDAWEYTNDALGRFFERIQTLPAESNQAPNLPTTSIVKLASMEIPAQAADLIGSYFHDARVLGERTAAMHLALSSETDDLDFRPEPWTPHAQRGLFQSMRNLARQNFQLLSQRLPALPPEIQDQARQILALEPEILQRLRKVYDQRIDAVRIRIHGDFHLGQVLHTGKDFLIIDFEGEPAIALSQRRLKRSPMRDIAGMIRSFHYAANATLLKRTQSGTIQATQLAAAANWARYWSWWVSAAYFRAYLDASASAPFLPAKEGELEIMMESELLRKAIYELGYDLNNRPAWVGITFRGILELLNH